MIGFRYEKARFRLPHVSALLLILCLVLVPSTGRATTGRIQALGGNGAFFEDEANVLRWYGSLVDYPDLAVLETGSFNLYQGYNNQEMDLVSGPGGGLHCGFGENDGWGTAALYFHGRNLDSPFAGYYDGGLNGSLSLIYARPVGPVSAALKFRHGNSSSVDSVGYVSPPVRPIMFQQDLTETDIGCGLRMDLTETTYLDLAGEVCLIGVKETATATDWTTEEYESNSWKNFQIRSRAFIQLGENSALVPVAELMLIDTPIASETLYSARHSDRHMIRAGCGLNYFPDTDRFLMISVEYRGGETELIGNVFEDRPFVQRWTWDSFLCDLGAESRLLPWLSLRASIQHGYRWISETWTNPELVAGNPEDIDWEGVSLHGNLGVGVHLGKYDLDLALTNNFPTTPSGFIGYSEFQDDSNWLTATLRTEF